MLKVWKDSSRRSHSMHLGSSPGRELAEIGVDDPIVLLETSSLGLAPEVGSNTVALKRTRQSSNQDSDIHSTRSSKKAKTSASHSAHQKHLFGAFTSASADELLEIAKTRNSKFSARNLKNTSLTVPQQSLYIVAQMV